MLSGNWFSRGVVILFGKMSIDTFLPKQSLEACIGRTFDLGGIHFIPLPHSSGASTWLNDADHRALLTEAIERVREARAAYLPEDVRQDSCHGMNSEAPKNSVAATQE